MLSVMVWQRLWSDLWRSVSCIWYGVFLSASWLQPGGVTLFLPLIENEPSSNLMLGNIKIPIFTVQNTSALGNGEWKTGAS